jgi:hypothetical protein
VSWTCPYCQMPQVVTSDNSYHSYDYLRVGYEQLGDQRNISYSAIRCLNKKCQQMTFHVMLNRSEPTSSGRGNGKIVSTWRLMPTSSSKPQPEFIPKALRDDYEEACAIAELSPKASATLSRRCLQGMIRHFCGIAKDRLIDEIKELRRQVDENSAPAGVTIESAEAIDAVRSVGNIGAHMEKNIDLIVEVDEGEARTLIELIELLFQEWYVARQQRQERFARVAAIAAEKKALIAQAKAEGDNPA